MKLYCEFCRRFVFERDPEPKNQPVFRSVAGVDLILCWTCGEALRQHLEDRTNNNEPAHGLETLIAFATGRAFARALAMGRLEMHENLTGELPPLLPKSEGAGRIDWSRIPDRRSLESRKARGSRAAFTARGYVHNAAWKRRQRSG